MKTFTSPYHTKLMQTSHHNSSTSSEEIDEKEYHNTETVRNIEPVKEKPKKQHNKVLLKNTRALMNTLILSHIRCIDIEMNELMKH